MQSRCRFLRISLFALLLASPVLPAAAQDALVLGGGGSRGLAHAGAIEGLTRKGFRPDMVLGTSMGAIMGALYASGLPSDSIWQLTRTIDWQETFAFPRVRTTPDGEAARPFLNLGVGVDRTRFSEGLVADRRVNRLLVRLLFEAGARAHGDFDRLALPFRPVAADLATGEAVAIDRGDLALAVRASMAVPGIFAPVITDDGRYLVDGGIVDYLPVKTAHAEGARRVVSVDVIRPPAGNMGHLNPFQVAIRAFRLTLRHARPDGSEPDVAIEPEIDPNLSAAIFLRDATPLLETGLDAALRQFPDSFIHRERSVAGGGPEPPAPPLGFAAVRIESNDPRLVPMAERVFARLAGTTGTAQDVLRAADRLDASGFFTGIWPRLEPDGTLVVRADAEPPAVASGAAGYDADRGPRVMAMLRARRGSGEFTLGARLGSIDSRATLSVRRPLAALPLLAPTAGIAYRERRAREFDGQRVAAERKVRRAGGWAGWVWTATDGKAEAVAAFRADHVDRDAGRDGAALGFSVRLAGREPNARIVGTPAVLEVERRWGDVAWSDVRARGGLAFGGTDLRAALVADLASSSVRAPIDVLPALGEENGLPGLRIGSRRGPARVIGGFDVAYPVLFEGHARLRVRTGAVASKLEDLDSARWVTGAELGLVWWTPFGRVTAGAGKAWHGDWRAHVDIGPIF